jgi:dihydrofolate synthase/folylpolyglutamate synthase
VENHKLPSNNLNDWLVYLESIHPKKINLGLDRVSRVKKQAALDFEVPVIIVGGTNGKGSVCSHLESIFLNANYKVGCYTSPHIHRFNERIRINQNEVADNEIVESLQHIEKVREKTELTYFEFTTLAAADIFKKHKVDIAILEVGLGGRLDAVNVFDPTISIINSISFDHQDYLGDTLESIGYEKAGIMRPAKTTIINFEDVPHSVIAYATKMNATLNIVNKDYQIYDTDGKTIYKSNDHDFFSVDLSDYKFKSEKQNIAAVIRCCELLLGMFPNLMDAVNTGIKSSKLVARLQIIQKNPCVIVDVAHNEESAVNLSLFCKDHMSVGKSKAVFSCLKDKDIKKIIRNFNFIDEWLIAEICNDRKMSIKEIESEIKLIHSNIAIKKFNSIYDAYHSAIKHSHAEDSIIVFGSFYTVAQSGVLN